MSLSDCIIICLQIPAFLIKTTFCLLQTLINAVIIIVIQCLSTFEFLIKKECKL